MDTPSPQRSGIAAPKASASENPREILLLKKQSLMRSGLAKGGESDAEIERIYADQQLGAPDPTIAEEFPDTLAAVKAFQLESLRDGLRRFGIDPTGMDEATMLARGREARDQRNAQRLADQQSQRASRLFRDAHCPTRQTLALAAIDRAGDAPAEWFNLRDDLARQARYANGFLVALLGMRGNGKTQLAISVIDRCCRRGMTCRYVKALDLFRDIRRAYTPTARGEAGEAEADRIEEWAGFDLLVVDECDKRTEREFEQNIINNLLDIRYDERKCTILIANQDRAQFAVSVGDSVVSRIHETGEAFECNWPSRRRPGQWRRQDGDELRQPGGLPKKSEN